VEHVGQSVGAAVMSPDAFREFYRRVLPDVYGYVLRLCAGDRAQAEDLTQDVWLALIEELRLGRTERADIRWLITVARSRFLDHARRERLRGSKLELIRHVDEADTEPTDSDVLGSLADLAPLHRAVLVWRYVDNLPVADVAALVGRGLTATNSLLARARADLRRCGVRPTAGGNPDA
jgi:RNA polymerase sigma-70 factor (ECF subfamily)